MNNTITAVVLGNLLKAEIARQIVELVNAGVFGVGKNVFRVKGDTQAELKEVRSRCFDAAKVFGVGLKSRKQNSTGSTVVKFHTGNYFQPAYFYSELVVTYKE